MKILDLLAMSINNLRRRPMRTALTVLGVVIGTASIVVMVSLGIGLTQLTQEQIASSGSLTEISIYSDAKWGGNQDGKTEPDYMNDEMIEKFKKLDHVVSASPLLEVNVIMKQGLYQGNINLIGVNKEYMDKIPLKEGNLPSAGGSMEMIVGNKVAGRFSNPKEDRANSRRMSYSMGSSGEEEQPDIDFMNKPLFVIFDADAYYESLYGGTTESGTPIKPPKKYLIPTVGMIEEGKDGGWNAYSYGIYTDIDQLKTQMKAVFKKGVIPNQPTNKKGKPYSYFVYDQAVVEVDEMANVTTVQKQLSDMGVQANSNMEWLESTQQTSDMVQAVLGGIGAVSLFVAAIGIANTMMMSIYERTKEIGVIKVLGCDMRNIRNMFLIESGFIGFMGGVTGTLLSYGISFIMNKFMLGKMMSGMMVGGEISGNLSRIPTWLGLSAIGFAILVGMVAGFFPSLRAMKLSPLAAIRND